MALEQAVRRLAAATLVARRWPQNRGSRHDIANALAGMLVRGGWSEEATAHFIRSVATAAGDEEARDRAGTAVSTARTIGAGRRATGAPTLARPLGQPLVDRLCDWLQLETLSSYRSFMSYRDLRAREDFEDSRRVSLSS